MKFIHCAGVHLDSTMTTPFPPETARERRREARETFLRLAEYAKKENVAAVLIAGELFDPKNAAPSTVDAVLNAIEGARGVDFLYVRGSRDETSRAFAGRTLPENLKIFSSKWDYYHYGSVTIAGAEPGTKKSVWQNLIMDLDRINLVLLHGASNEHPNGNIPLTALRGKRVRYLALGGQSAFQSAALDLEGYLCDCGFLEGRGFDESGEKGFVLLDVDEKQKRVRWNFVPFARRTLYDLSVDVSDREAELLPVLEAAAAKQNASPDSLIRFTLKGSVSPGAWKNPAALEKELDSRFYYAELRDRTHVDTEPASYEHDVSLRGELIRLVRASSLERGEQEQILRCGLQALRGVRWEDLEI